MAELVGIATWNFREGSLARRIERFAAMGFDAVSLIGSDGAALCHGAMPDVEEAILKHSLAVAIHGGLLSGEGRVDKEALLADFEQFLKWNERTGALHTVNYDAAAVRTDDGGCRYLAEEMRSVLAAMLARSNGAGFSVGVEDWPRDREQMAEVSQLAAYAHFGILIDLGHMNMRVRSGGGGEFPAKAAQSYLDAISLPVNEIHVHNNDGTRDMHAPPMSGSADLVAVADMLRRKGATCISTIEIVPGWCGLTEDEGWSAARESLRFWREVF